MGVLNRKLSEFLDLKQGSLSVMEYANKFNHLAPVGVEDAGCQDDVLPFPWWTAVLAASTDSSDTVDSLPCTYLAGAAATGTTVSTSSGVDGQVY
jgi:hypothetical protein